MEQERAAAEFFREEKLKEPSPRAKARFLATQRAGIRQFRFEEDQLRAIDRALVQMAKEMAGEER